ncbi:hypothetical protein EYF80_053417 [Liparis tanakae]|uniref:Uncharacterized protein n=1 Tax=Liparis tanakae TaxID=230148 RepID=A0A4Z2F5J2_9TELE|nr:hypothetical protein EYF80_053417 [Liparis tanakae]
MTRRKQEREGPPLPRGEISLHHKSQAGACSMRTAGPSLAIVPAPLLPCQRALPRTLIHAISVHFMSTSKSKQTGAASVSEEAVVFAVGERNLLVRSRRDAGH